jgi:hypothetical protein
METGAEAGVGPLVIGPGVESDPETGTKADAETGAEPLVN